MKRTDYRRLLSHNRPASQATSIFGGMQKVAIKNTKQLALGKRIKARSTDESVCEWYCTVLYFNKVGLNIAERLQAV
jgi:hypothetical protein